MRLNDHYLNLSPKSEIDRRNFSYGFIAGLAEKVFIGACRAAMVAPALQDAEWLEVEVEVIAEEYDLYIATIRRTNRIEYWLLKTLLDRDLLVASPDDNQLRGLLCGYPLKDIDVAHVIEAPIPE